MNKPEKPSERLLKLCEHEPFEGVRISMEQIGADTAKYFIILKDGRKEIKIPQHCAEADLLIFKPDWCSIARLHPVAQKQCQEWHEWVEQNKKDINELKRLKKKLGEK